MATVLEKDGTVSAKGQTTIPIEVRRALGVAAGDRVTFRVEADRSVSLHRAEDDSDPAMEAFLAFLAEDIRQRPEAMAMVGAALRDRLAALTAMTAFDRDSRIEGDVGL
ncbi:MAG: type II toxin-antitoxin system PrlF family antitoxin [Sphingomonas sp.]|jgi:antitoxin PrlF|uniref:type II toxin-antitoxin system PrlF family antitoxin n=1 Tax=Sphingomonas sp. TaxID=28214 RepID=UPI003562FFB9